MRDLRHLSAPACSFDDCIDRAIHDQVNQTIFRYAHDSPEHHPGADRMTGVAPRGHLDRGIEGPERCDISGCCADHPTNGSKPKEVDLPHIDCPQLAGEWTL